MSDQQCIDEYRGYNLDSLVRGGGLIRVSIGIKLTIVLKNKTPEQTSTH
jgi:hypothetical protein